MGGLGSSSLFEVRNYEEVVSTNDLIKQAISDGDPEGTVVCAVSQTGGYGRRGHHWASQPGGLYMSVLLRPQGPRDDIQTVSLMVSVAVRRALALLARSQAADRIRIKWPNDIVLVDSIAGAPCAEGGKHSFDKLCGISVELREGALCIGIGVNVHAPEKAATLAESKNSLVFFESIAANADVTVGEVRDAVLHELEAVYETWLHGSFAAIKDEFQSNFALDGFKVRIDSESTREPVKGEVIGVNDKGHLLVMAPDAADPIEVVAGSVSLCGATV